MLRNRFLGGIAYGALYAAEGAAGGAVTPTSQDGSASAGTTGASAAEAGTSPAAAAAPAEPAAPAGAIDSGEGAQGAKATDGAAAPAAAPSMIADASALAPGAEQAKPDAAEKPAAEAKPDGDVKPDAGKEPAKEGEKPEAKPAEAAKQEPAKEPANEPAKPEPRTYEAFKLPDNVKLDDARVKEFTDVLDASDLSHQDRAQKLVDMFIAELGNVQKARDDYQRDVWTAYQDKQRDELRSDPDVGGNRMETALGRSKWVIEQFGGPADRQKRLLDALTYTGMGNNRDLTYLLDRMANVLWEGDLVPAADHQPKDQRTRKERWYGGNGQSAG